MTAWSDAPIRAIVDDEFERSAYAIRAASLVANSHAWDESIVFGLTGPWGSGKSSMLAMITESLTAEHPEWCVAQFTPWATGDVAGLLGDFYASLSKALPPDRGKKVRASLGTLLEVAAPAASVVPYAGGLLGSAARSGGAALKKQSPWDIAFQKACDDLKELKSPVLLVADDIDRLQTQELLTLLKVVRLLGRFPGVDYLLAYDEATLFQALSEANLVAADDGGAGRFMEKIVQYPLVVPPMLGAQLLTRLDAGLEKAFTEAGRPALSSRRLGRLEAVFRSVLSTPRAIDRFLAQLRHHLPLVAVDEINDEDVVVLTLLRTAFPTLYQALPRWREQLLTGNTSEIETYNPLTYRRFNVDDLLGSIPAAMKADARTLLIDLFPRLKEKNLFGARDRGISRSRYFDRYFAMGIPVHDVADVEVAEAVASAALGDGDALRTLLTGSKADRVTLVVEKGRPLTEAYPSDEAADERRLALVKLLLGAYEEVVEQRSFFFSPRERVASWASRLLRDLRSEVSATDVETALAAASTLRLRLNVVNDAVDAEEPLTGWVADVVGSLVVDARTGFLSHLGEGDAAEGEGPGWHIHFVSTFGDTSSLATDVEVGLAGGHFTIEDLASRFVKLRLLSGASDWELSEFDQDAFNKLAPATAHPWFDSPKVEVDLHDLSWANRRKFSAGRARQPVP